MNIGASLDLFCFEKYLKYAENELLNFGKWKNFMFDQWLAICWDIIEMVATLHSRKSFECLQFYENCRFAFPSTNETKLIQICCYFGLHFG